MVPECTWVFWSVWMLLIGCNVMFILLCAANYHVAILRQILIMSRTRTIEWCSVSLRISKHSEMPRYTECLVCEVGPRDFHRLRESVPHCYVTDYQSITHFHESEFVTLLRRRSKTRSRVEGWLVQSCSEIREESDRDGSCGWKRGNSGSKMSRALWNLWTVPHF